MGTSSEQLPAASICTECFALIDRANYLGHLNWHDQERQIRQGLQRHLEQLERQLDSLRRSLADDRPRERPRAAESLTDPRSVPFDRGQLVPWSCSSCHDTDVVIRQLLEDGLGICCASCGRPLT